jgi:hypothetical protein
MARALSPSALIMTKHDRSKGGVVRRDQRHALKRRRTLRPLQGAQTKFLGIGEIEHIDP